MKQDARFPNLFIVNHPIVQHKLNTMRKRETSSCDFSRLLRELTYLVSYEATGNLATEIREIETPICPMKTYFLSGKDPVIVPVLRAGLGMTAALHELIPSASIGFVGMYRGSDLRPVEYLVKLPADMKDRKVFVVDPMLATGFSAIAAMDALIKRGVKAEDIVFISLLAAPEGVENFQKAYPTIPVYTASLDEKLNEDAYIVPGLGDAGDRLFGTE